MRPPPLLQIQHCVSLGPTCNAAEYLRCHPAGLRRYALPFDWIHSDAALVRGMPQTARTPNEPDLARDHSQHSTAPQCHPGRSATHTLEPRPGQRASLTGASGCSIAAACRVWAWAASMRTARMAPAAPMPPPPPRLPHGCADRWPSHGGRRGDASTATSVRSGRHTSSSTMTPRCATTTSAGSIAPVSLRLVRA